jgi:branched-chain amino acid transport system permease protein
MSVAAQAVEGSIATGAIYGLVGSGFAVIFRATKVLSFTQSGFMLVGAFTFYDIITVWKLGFLLAILISAAAVAALSALVYFFVFARVASSAAFATSIATIGLAGVFQAIIAIKFGTTPLTLPLVVSSHSYKFLGVFVPTVDIISTVIALIGFALLLMVLRFTPVGRRMEAVADNAPLAVHLGVSAARTSTAAWALAGATAAVAGSIFSLRTFVVDPAGTSNLAMVAFPAIILAGMDSVGGVLLGGLIFAGVQNFVYIVWGEQWVTIASFVMMLALLGVRPSGFFGTPDAVRL